MVDSLPKYDPDRRFPKTHKKIGYIISMMFIPFMAELGYTLFIKGMVCGCQVAL
jgi:hypothetical protein